MREIKAIIQPFMLEAVLHALAAIDELPGITVSQVIGWGRTRTDEDEQTVEEAGHAFAKKTKLELVVPAALASRVVDTIVLAARTGRPGDGRVFESHVSRAVKIRNGDEAEAAL